MQTIAIVLSAAVLMLLLERLTPGQRLPAVGGWWPRAVLLNLVQAGSVFITAVTWDRWLPGLGLVDGAGWSMAQQVIAGYLLITFVYYWWHRARHQVPALWRWLHQVHHSPSRLEVVTSFYKHPFEILANAFLSAFILHVLLGISATAAAITVLVTGLAELIYHWNARTPYWMGFLFQRPEMHRVHHQHGYHRNNYSDLPLWDILFGTFENPRQVPARCGFEEGDEQQLLPMLMGNDLYRRRNREIF